MAETTILSIRIDKDLKNQADEVFSALGMSITTAINVFVRQAVRERKIPFEISLFSNEDKALTMRETIAAAERMWKQSMQNDTDSITIDEIDAEIAAVRSERKLRAG
jgi:DNA-damage-inducible protein J